MNKKQILVPCAGYTIAADWYQNGDDKNTVLILPGYTSSKKRYEDFVTHTISKAGVSALVIDYSGHGKSPLDLNDTRPGQHFLEVIYAFDWLRTNYPKAAVSVIGTSYGGFHAAHLTRYRDFKKLLLRAPAIYQPQDLYSLQPDIDRGFTSNVFRKDAAALARHPLFYQPPVFTGQTLLIAHEKDEDVPTQTTNAYAKAFNATVHVAKGFKHSMSDPDNPQSSFAEYYGVVAQWLRAEPIR